MNLTSRNTAANETGGQTVLKKFHIDYRNIQKVIETACKFYPRLGLVILNKISLFYGALVDLLDELISKMKDAIGEMFGNVHVIMVGDFLQFAAKNDGSSMFECEFAVLTKAVLDSPKQPITFRPVEKPIVLVLGIKAPIIFTQDTFDQTSSYKIERGTIGKISKFTVVRNQIWAITMIIEGYNHPLTFQRILVKTKKTKHTTESLAVFNFRYGVATTSDQAQGRTLKGVMIDTSRGELYPAQFYTGASRVCNADALHFRYLSLYVTGTLEPVINPDKGAINEHKEWRKRWKHVELPSDVANFVHDDEENTPKPE